MSILQTCTECSGLQSFLKEHSYFYAIAFSRTILRKCQGTLVQKLKKNVRCIKKNAPSGRILFHCGVCYLIFATTRERETSLNFC